MSDDECRSPIGLDCCSCCLDLANGCDDSLSQGLSTTLASPTSPSVSHFRQLRNQLMYQNLNTDKLNNIMRQDSLESVVRDPCFLLNEGICNSNIDQTMLSILLFFHRLHDTMDCLAVPEIVENVPDDRECCGKTGQRLDNYLETESGLGRAQACSMGFTAQKACGRAGITMDLDEAAQMCSIEG